MRGTWGERRLRSDVAARCPELFELVPPPLPGAHTVRVTRLWGGAEGHRTQAGSPCPADPERPSSWLEATKQSSHLSGESPPSSVSFRTSGKRLLHVIVF